MAAFSYLRATNSQNSLQQASFLVGKCKVALIKKLSVPKMELEANVIGERLLELNQRKMTLTFNKIFLWSDSQVVFDWIASNKKQNIFVSNRLQENHKISSLKQWDHISTCLNPARSIKTLKPVVSPTKFSTWKKLLLTVATVFNLIHCAKKLRTTKHQYTAEDIQLSRICPLKLSQDNFIHSAVNSFQHGNKRDSNCKIRCLIPLLDENELLRSCGPLQYAPRTTGFGKTSHHFARQGQNFFFVVGICPSVMYSPIHRTNTSLHTTKSPCDRPSENASKHTISLFLMSTL